MIRTKWTEPQIGKHLCCSSWAPAMQSTAFRALVFAIVVICSMEGLTKVLPLIIKCSSAWCPSLPIYCTEKKFAEIYSSNAIILLLSLMLLGKWRTCLSVSLVYTVDMCSVWMVWKKKCCLTVTHFLVGSVNFQLLKCIRTECVQALASLNKNLLYIVHLWWLFEAGFKVISMTKLKNTENWKKNLKRNMQSFSPTVQD